MPEEQPPPPPPPPEPPIVVFEQEHMIRSGNDSIVETKTNRR